MHALDQHLGKKIHDHRVYLKIPAQRLAAELNCTVEQVICYEHGWSRVEPSVLLRIAEVFDAPISYFFSDHAREEATRVGLPR